MNEDLKSIDRGFKILIVLIVLTGICKVTFLILCLLDKIQGGY